MKKFFCRALTNFSLLALASVASAQQPEVQTLAPVVVTADRNATSIKNVSQNITVITAEDIRNSGATTIVDLLKTQGIQTTWLGSENSGREGVVMRGGTSSTHGFDLSGDILILIDGRRAGSDALSSFAINNAAKIEVVRGPGAVQYGSSAMGGVINIITKRGQEGLQANVESGFGSWDQARVKAYLGGKNDNFDLAVSGSYFTGNDYKDGAGRRQINSGLDYRNHYGLNLGRTFNDNHRLGLNFMGMTGQDQGMGDNYNLQQIDSKNNVIDLSYEGQVEDRSKSWLIRYYTGKTDYEQNRLHAPTDSRYIYSTFENKYQGSQGQVSLDFGRLHSTVGLDWLYYKINQNQPISQNTTAQNANYSDSVYENIGLFLLNKLHLLEDENLILSAGVRYDRFDVTVDTTKGAATRSYVKTYKVNENKTFLPSFGIAFNPIEQLKFRANWGQSFKMPSPRQIGGVFNMGTRTVYYGNPDLKPERATTWDLGFDADWQALNLSATYFKSRYKDKIGVRRLSATTRDYINLDQATISGLELYTSYDLGLALDQNFRLQPYLSLTELFKYEDNKNKLSGVARTTLSYGLKFHHPDAGLTTSVDFTYFDKRPEDDIFYSATIADVTLSKSIYEFDHGGDMKLKFSLKNIFNKEYETSSNAAMPGRNYYVGLAYDFE